MIRHLLYEDYTFQSMPCVDLAFLEEKYPEYILTEETGYCSKVEGSQGWWFIRVYGEEK